jgi:hypothetical protein
MTSYAVRLEVPLTARAGDRTAAIVGRLDDRLAAWPRKSVRDAQLESQLGRGGRVGKVRATMTVQAADAAGALAVALEVLRQAIGADARSWDVAAAAATVAPVGGAVPEPLRRPNLVWRKPLPGALPALRCLPGGLGQACRDHGRGSSPECVSTVPSAQRMVRVLW